MAVKKLLNKGTVYKRNDNRRGGAVRYRDEQGVTRRKGFCAPTKKALLRKIKDYIITFQKEILGLLNSDIDLYNSVMYINRAVKEVKKATEIYLTQEKK